MSYKTFVSMNIAVIGLGEQATEYANNLSCAGHQVFVAATSDSRDTLGSSFTDHDNIVACSVEDAAMLADLVIIASPPREVREAAYWLGDMRGKVVIDCSANVVSSGEEYVNTTGAITAITGSQYVVKTFSTRGYEQLLQPLFKKTSALLMMAGESKKAKELTKILARELGVGLFFDLGGNEALPLFDELTRCWKKLADATTLMSKKLMLTKRGN